VAVVFYTNVIQVRNKIYIRGYLDGKRYTEEVRYKPYIFIPVKDDRDTVFKTIYGDKVEKLQFDSIREARKFTQTYKDVDGFKFYGLTRFVYTCINDRFPGEIQYDPNVVRTWIIDIETDSSNGFGDPRLANKAITCIGVRFGKKRIVFGCGDYSTNDPNIIYIHCKDEKDLLRKFINLWVDEDYGPDIVTGWNIEAYDIPYIVNRIRLLLGEDEVKRLSPFGLIEEKLIQAKYGKEVQTFIIAGISILDYMLLYKKFKSTQLESYSLDHVAFVETKRGKLDYSEYESLNELFINDYTKFINYNVTDLDRVADIDDKNKFIELVMSIAYDAKVNLVDSLTSVLLWDVIGHNYLLSQNKVIPQHLNNPEMVIPGAYVKEPVPGMKHWVVCFDYTSLYPRLIMLLNISPETLAGFKEWGMYEFNQILNGEFDNTEIKTLNVSQAANGARYRRDIYGFLPELMRHGFNIRKEAKKKMNAAKAAYEKNKTPELEKEIAKYENLQLTKKIQLNSLYGSLANPGYRFYDYRNSSAITLTGQLAAKWVEQLINKLMGERYGNKDYVIAVDTDSVYIDCSDFMKGREGESLNDNADFLDNIMQTIIQPTIDQSLLKLAETLNAYEPALEMKREVLANKAIWKAKKMYIMNVLDSERVRYDKPELKMMGIEAIRSSTPVACRDAIKETLKLIMTGTNDDVVHYIEKFKKHFWQLPFEDIAFPRGINGIEKYFDPINGWAKGTPIHVKGALVYNNEIKKRKLEAKYSLISDKDKVKYCYLYEPNPVFSKVISVPKVLPKVLGLENYLDRKTQFEKTYLDPMKTILTIISWDWEINQSIEAFLSG
jgi:DNA polymerase elongation subunit (family B)